MKKVRIREERIIKVLKEYAGGREIKDICRELGISSTTFYNWRKKYSGMESSQLKRLKELEQENKRLKQMYADVSLDNTMLKDVLSKKW